VKAAVYSILVLVAVQCGLSIYDRFPVKQAELPRHAFASDLGCGKMIRAGARDIDKSLTQTIEISISTSVPTPATVKIASITEYESSAGDVRLFMVDCDCQNLAGALVRSQWLVKVRTEHELFGKGYWPETRLVGGVDPSR
jgi:hypothetical protein